MEQGLPQPETTELFTKVHLQLPQRSGDAECLLQGSIPAKLTMWKKTERNSEYKNVSPMLMTYERKLSVTTLVKQGGKSLKCSLLPSWDLLGAKHANASFCKYTYNCFC